jgi:beta-galactosidase/beta-glucuronidase
MKIKLLAVLTLIVIMLLCLPALSAQAAVTFTGSEWTGKPHGFGINSENSRAHYYTYDSQKSALAGYTMYPEREGNTFYKTLSDLDKVNGAWRFHFAINPSQRPWPTTSPQVGVASRFLEADFNDSGWDHIAVPSNWQVNWVAGTTTLKYDKPNYKNTNYGWGNSMTYNGTNYTNSNMNNPNGTPMGVGTAQQAPQGYNSVGTHRRHFTVPENWKGRNVTLNFAGVDGFYVWINGVPIGYSDNTFAHKEFDITDALNFDSDNIIVVQVIRWTTGSWLEDQDFMRLSGIFRDIFLLARNKTDQVDLFDFEVKTTPTVANNYTGNWNLSITGFLRDWAATATPGRDNATLYAQLFDIDGNPVSAEISSSAGDFTTITTDPLSTNYSGWQIGKGFRNLSLQGARRTLNFTGLNVQPWSAEHPTLYKLVLRVGDVYTCIRVGFRHYSFTNESTSPRSKTRSRARNTCSISGSS